MTADLFYSVVNNWWFFLHLLLYHWLICIHCRQSAANIDYIQKGGIFWRVVDLSTQCCQLVKKGHAMCYHVYVTMHFKDPILFAVRV